MSHQTLIAHVEALFISDLQSSQQPSAAQVRAAVRRALQTISIDDVAALAAQEYGDHPESSVTRMRWAWDQVLHAYDSGGSARAIRCATLPAVPVSPRDGRDEGLNRDGIGVIEELQPLPAGERDTLA